MNSRVSYALVGAFVITATALLIGLALWFGADRASPEHDRYLIRFQDSVSGLSKGAAVKYLGVPVGRVHAIRLDSDRPGQVAVTIGVDPDTRITTATVAEVATQGLTGNAFVALSGGDPGAAGLTADDEGLPVIASRPSMLSRLQQSLADGLESLQSVAGQARKLLADDNQAALRRSLDNVERFTRTLADNRDSVERSLQNIETATARARTASEDLPGLVAETRRAMTELRSTVEDYRAAAAEVTKAGQAVRTAAGTTQRAASTAAERVLPQLNRLLSDIEQLSGSLTELSDSLNRNPEMLIYGRPPRPAGPGEEP